MYLEHFGLREAPFSLTPDPSYFFNHPGHRQALNVLLVALRTGEGFIKITGEVGTGKTLLCRKLLEVLQEEFVTAYLPNPLLAPRELYHAVAAELGLEPPSDSSFHQLLKLLTDALVARSAEGKQVVVILDEVQAMPNKSLEALRLLSNLETEKRKLLQIVLFGQPELDTRLDQAALRQLRQRITFSYRLEPLTREVLRDYVAHRLLVAGHQGGALFNSQAIEMLYRASRGIPRLVNILCHKAMLAAFGRGDRTIGKGHLRGAAEDTEDTSPIFSFPVRRFLFGSLGLILVLEVAALVVSLRGGTL
jgi:MSHA biogenesis protein MshM